MSKHEKAKRGGAGVPPEMEESKARKVEASTIDKESKEYKLVDPEADQDQSCSTSAQSGITEPEGLSDEMLMLKEKATKKEKEAKDYFERLSYMAAEFDNFRRRSAKEKEKRYTDALVDVAVSFLPVIDNLERAAKAGASADLPETATLREGVGMIVRQIADVLSKLEIKEITAIGNAFDPNLHHAVMHIEDEAYGKGEIIDVFQKGYIYKDEIVVRHSMVKVAN